MRLRSSIAIGLVAVFALSGCAANADVFPLNDAAKRIGDPQIRFVRQGIDSGPVTITMSDGEVLRGTYHVARSGAFGMAFSNGQTATAVGFGDGNVEFVARGPRTEMLCRGSVAFNGRGSGECQTIDGATWAVSF